MSKPKYNTDVSDKYIFAQCKNGAEFSVEQINLKNQGYKIKRISLNKNGEICIVAKLKKKKLHRCLMHEDGNPLLCCEFRTDFRKKSICKNISKEPCRYRDSKFNRKIKKMIKNSKSKEEK